MYFRILTMFMALSFSTAIYSQQWNFQGGHSHNDYYQKRPLFEALENGMVSVEADVFFREGKLLVGHDVHELQKEKSLEKLYLQPLFHLAKDSKNRLSPLILMIDIKDRDEATYAELKKVLIPYHDILSRCVNGVLITKQVTIILSGARPIDVIRKEKERYVFIDGRIEDLNRNESSLLFPLISENWNDHFTWKGEGEISPKEFEKLQKLTEKCHQQNKIIRFWGIPIEQAKALNFWKTLNMAKVDLLGNDCPKCLNEYLGNTNKEN
ncbi:MAG: hypothetical protein JKX79_03480 [Labilibaculum sp.]|nr:hypothetical protein [Labilibaculum sp.]